MECKDIIGGVREIFSSASSGIFRIAMNQQLMINWQPSIDLIQSSGSRVLMLCKELRISTANSIIATIVGEAYSFEIEHL